MSTHSKAPSVLAASALAILLAAGVACGPVSAIDRATPVDGGFGTGGAGGGGAGGQGSAGAGGQVTTGGAGGQATGGRGGQSGQGGQATSQGGAGGGAGGQSPDSGPPPPPDMRMDEPTPMPIDTAPVTPRALVVIGDPAAKTLGDIRLGSMVQARGFEVTYLADEASSAAAQGMSLVVLSSSVGSSTLAAKYKDVTVPVLVMESHVFDDMKLTGPTKATDYDEEDDSRVTIYSGMDAHPLAAYYSGSVTVVSNVPATATPCCGINWGRPAASAVKVAAYGTGGGANANKVTIFAYDKKATMVDGFVAPARRVGFFAADTTVQYLSVDGLKLFNAAVSWLVEP